MAEQAVSSFMVGFLVYLRAMSAFLLPLAVFVGARGGFLAVMAQIASEQPLAKWLGSGAIAGLVVLEWRWMVTLLRLIRVGGRIAAFVDRDSDPEELRRRRRLRLRLAASGLAVLVALLVCEIVFRLFQIEPPAPAPSAELEWAAFGKSVNALGIREPWDSLPEDDRRLRIACLGDSITLGDNVEPDEGFCHLLEDRLYADWPDGVVTINMGFRGTAPGGQHSKFLTLRDALCPRIVIHVVYPNDLGLDTHHLLDGIYGLRDEDLWIGKGSYVLRFTERQIRYWLAWNKTIDYFRRGETSAERAAAWKGFKDDVRECKATVEADGSVYALVLFPWLVRLHDYLLTDVHEQMRDFATELEVPYLDLLEVFAGQDAEGLRVSLANEHPNTTGHSIAAQRIARLLREEIMPALPR